MIISEKQVLRIIIACNEMMRMLWDIDNMEPCVKIKNYSDLFNEILNQQSEELKVIE